MIASPVSYKHSFKLRLATLMLVGMTGLVSLVITAWFTGDNTVTGFFKQLYALQQYPPVWLMPPATLGNIF